MKDFRVGLYVDCLAFKKKIINCSKIWKSVQNLKKAFKISEKRSEVGISVQKYEEVAFRSLRKVFKILEGVQNLGSVQIFLFYVSQIKIKSVLIIV